MILPGGCHRMATLERIQGNIRTRLALGCSLLWVGAKEHCCRESRPSEVNSVILVF